MKSRFLLVFAALLICTAMSAQEKREDKLYMPKGSAGIGLQVSYFDLGSTDSDVMLLLKNLNAQGTYASVAPYFFYSYKDNKAVGLRFKYSKLTGGVANADISLFSEDLSFKLSGLSANTRSFQVQAFHRSYMGLDERGRFGLFNDMVLSYTNSRVNLALSEDQKDAYSITRKVKLGVCPGIMIFILNNLSTHVSVSIGGVSYSHINCYEKGTQIGKRNQTKAHFTPDITDISFGMTLFL